MRRFTLPAFAANRSGAAAVEFGLIAPILIAVLLGVMASSGSIYQHHTMRKAVGAGAQLVMTSEADLEAIRDLTLEAWPGKADGSSVDVSQWCRCGATQHSCSTTCSDGDYPEKFILISAAAPYTGPLGSQTLSASQLVRTR